MQDNDEDARRPRPENIGTSLVKSILSPNVLDIASDITELVLDSSLDEGVLKEIPVVGWGIKLWGAASTVKERIFLNKVAKFLQASAAISESG